MGDRRLKSICENVFLMDEKIHILLHESSLNNLIHVYIKGLVTKMVYFLIQRKPCVLNFMRVLNVPLLCNTP